jgi:hypothetical protein
VSLSGASVATYGHALASSTFPPSPTHTCVRVVLELTRTDYRTPGEPVGPVVARLTRVHRMRICSSSWTSRYLYGGAQTSLAGGARS